MLNKITEAWKTIVTAAGFVLLVWNQYSPGFSSILPASWQHYISAVIAVLTLITQYGVPNVTADPARAVGRSVRVKGQKPAKAA